MSTIHSFISKRKQQTRASKQSITNNSAAFLSPADIVPVKPLLSVNGKVEKSETTKTNIITTLKTKSKASKVKSTRAKTTKEGNTITNYFTSNVDLKEKIKEPLDDEIVLCNVRKTVPLLDAWNHLLEEYNQEEEEEHIILTVRKTKPLTDLWDTILQELYEDNSRGENKRKNKDEQDGIKKQKSLFLSSFMYNAPLRRKLSVEESSSYMSAIMLEYQ
ncbi:unnamed protein product [Rhizopus stolonifer]